MSEIRRIVAHVGDSVASRQVLRFALQLADLHGASLSALHVVEPTPTGAYLTPEASSIATRLSAESDRTRRERAAALVSALALDIGREIPFDSLGGDPLTVLQREARAADLLVLGQRNPEVPDGTAAGFAGRLIVSVGGPLLFVPFAGEHTHCGSRVMVAWSDTRESARALRDALPLLRRAQRVELVRFARTDELGPEPLDGVAAHLLRHGVTAETMVKRSRGGASLGQRMLGPWASDTSIAEALLSQAADTRADLIVMGGYGHSRAWELALGGVTRTLLHTMTLPILMSH